MSASFSFDTEASQMIPKGVISLCEAFRENGYRAWIVGGCVRDMLRGSAPQDWDLATDARPEDTRRLFRRVIPTGIEHGTVTVIHQGTAYEVTTLRGEGAYVDGRRPSSVTFVDDLELDLSRRDFTVNAMALDPLEGRVSDPFRGREDLEAKCIRAVGDPLKRFQEDGLRPLRAARFCATLACTLDPETAAAIPKTLDVFAKVSNERVRDEWEKSLKAKRPSDAFRVMKETGLLGVCAPSLDEAAEDPWSESGVVRRRWEVLLTTLDAVRDAKLPGWALLAALFHGVEGTMHASASVADAWLKRYRFSTAARQDIARALAHGLFETKADPRPASARRWMAKVGRDHATVLVDFHAALLEGYRRAGAGPLGSLPLAVAGTRLGDWDAQIRGVLERRDPLFVKDLAVHGGDLMTALAMPRGPKIGRCLEELLARVLEDPSLYDRATLLALAEQEIAR